MSASAAASAATIALNGGGGGGGDEAMWTPELIAALTKVLDAKGPAAAAPLASPSLPPGWHAAWCAQRDTWEYHHEVARLHIDAAPHEYTVFGMQAAQLAHHHTDTGPVHPSRALQTVLKLALSACIDMCGSADPSQPLRVLQLLHGGLFDVADVAFRLGAAAVVNCDATCSGDRRDANGVTHWIKPSRFVPFGIPSLDGLRAAHTKATTFDCILCPLGLHFVTPTTVPVVQSYLEACAALLAPHGRLVCLHLDDDAVRVHLARRGATFATPPGISPWLWWCGGSEGKHTLHARFVAAATKTGVGAAAPPPLVLSRLTLPCLALAAGRAGLGIASSWGARSFLECMQAGGVPSQAARSIPPQQQQKLMRSLHPVGAAWVACLRITVMQVLPTQLCAPNPRQPVKHN